MESNDNSTPNEEAIKRPLEFFFTCFKEEQKKPVMDEILQNADMNFLKALFLNKSIDVNSLIEHMISEQVETLIQRLSTEHIISEQVKTLIDKFSSEFKALKNVFFKVSRAFA